MHILLVIYYKIRITQNVIMVLNTIINASAARKQVKYKCQAIVIVKKVPFHKCLGSITNKLGCWQTEKNGECAFMWQDISWENKTLLEEAEIGNIRDSRVYQSQKTDKPDIGLYISIQIFRYIILLEVTNKEYHIIIGIQRTEHFYVVVYQHVDNTWSNNIVPCVHIKNIFDVWSGYI